MPDPSENAVTIQTGPADWQILQQDERGEASITLAGRWWTFMKRKKPEVLVRVVREGWFDVHDWTRAKTVVDRSVKGEAAGKAGSWRLTLKHIPCGGPYRVETSVGSAEDAVEWRRGGELIHFLGVGDVWLIAGQSNAEGYGRDPIDDPSELGVHAFSTRGRWELAAHGSLHHPWLAFAKTLKKDLGYPIGLIPTAVGGSAISRWDPGRQGDLFEQMKRRLADSGTRIKGALWYQGESDVGADEHPRYKARFVRFLKGLRRVAKQPGLPVITVQLNRVLGGEADGRGWEVIREIQRQLSHELDQVFVIPIFEAGLCDGIHISSLGNMLIAQRAATTALGAVYGRVVSYKHPTCVSARQVSGKVIDLRFDQVVERLQYDGDPRNGFPFAVRDGEGEVPVAGFKLPRRNLFRILLARSLVGPASVTGAPGACPPQNLPRDIHGYRCMLGFTAIVRMK